MRGEDIMEKKLTKKEVFAIIRGIVEDRPELVDFIDHEIELLERKNSKTTQTATQKENEGIKVIILEELANIPKPVTISELQTASAKLSVYSNQKLSALLKQLVDSQEVVKTSDKKKSYFTLAGDAEVVD